ncbi:MAG TPA: hypothetical protein VEB86_06890 [Chryseosolibacter sp.]|nr:hypothetical protein [Chryseosolibacter sp.]
MGFRLITLVFFLLPLWAFAQSAESTFHMASNHYIHNKMGEAKKTLDDGLKKFPNDPKLNALRQKIKEEEKQNDQNQDQQNKDQKDQQQKDNEKKDDKQQGQEKKEGDEGEEQQKKEKEKKETEESAEEEEKKKQQKKDLQNFDPAKIPNMTPEKALMILEAMKNQEKQYLQQNKRKATKSRDRSKPDW